MCTLQRAGDLWEGPRPLQVTVGRARYCPPGSLLGNQGGGPRDSTRLLSLWCLAQRPVYCGGLVFSEQCEEGQGCVFFGRRGSGLSRLRRGCLMACVYWVKPVCLQRIKSRAGQGNVSFYGGAVG